MQNMSTLNRLTALRKILSAKQLQAYILPSEDEHFSEYVDPADKRYSFISGFTGSTCTAVITLNQAAIWVDGRYHLQGARELDENWTLMKQGLPNVPDESTWLVANTPSGCRIGFDPKQLPFTKVQAYERSILEAEKSTKDCSANRSLVGIVGPNLVDIVWDEFSSISTERCSRPTRPNNPLFTAPSVFATPDWRIKLNDLRQRMTNKNVHILVLSALDEIAWLLNLRGSDIQYNPLFFSYLLLTSDAIHLYIHPNTHAQSYDVLENYINDANYPVSIHPYCEFYSHLSTLVAESPPNSRVWCGLNANYAIVSSIPEPRRLIARSPVAEAKAVKSLEELHGIRSAHLVDNLVLCDFLAWLEETAERNRLSNNPHVLKGDICESAGYPSLTAPSFLTEASLAFYLDSLRSQSPNFVSLSFATIVACDANGAIIHYRPEPGQDLHVTPSSLLLLDSGAQYQTGTTDVTRTVHLGEPTDQQKACYTMVLKAHIALARQLFPANTPGTRLDALCRRELWNHRCDFAHGTGHGVGAFLCVHEGPIGLSGRRMSAAANLGVTEPGIMKNNVVTIEPGFYLENEFGIRLENVNVVVEAPTHEPTTIKPSPLNNDWLAFDPVTLVPFQQKLIDRSMLTSAEVHWINAYHATTREALKTQLTEELGATVDDLNNFPHSRKRCWEWIVRETAPLI